MRFIANLLRCFALLTFLFSFSAIKAQQDSSASKTISANVDLMTRYVWRGQDYGQTPSIQPAISATWRNYTLGFWGAYQFKWKGMQESDLYISKEIGQFTFSVWDYWSYCDTTSNDYFDYNHATTAHQFEAQLLFSGGPKLPFNLLGSYFFYGADTSKSIYLELQYLFSITKTDMMLFSGFQPKGEFYAAKAAFVNIGCTASKTIAITDKWHLPLSLSIIVNPNINSTHIVAGITF